jgi:hypothetical protein
LEGKELRRNSKAVNHGEVRNVILVLFCATVIGFIYLANLNKAQMALLNLIVLSSFSDKYTYLFETGRSDNGITDHSDTEIELRLCKAANQNRKVIITLLNAAWAKKNSMNDLFL